MMQRPLPKTSWAHRIARLSELKAIRRQRLLTPQETAEFDRTDALVFTKRRRLPTELQRARQRLKRLEEVAELLET